MYLRTKNKDRLKDILIKIRDMEYVPRGCIDEYFFRSKLLCADTLLFKEKFQPAKELIDRVLAKCKTFMHAYDYLLIYNEKTKEDSSEIL